MQIGIKPLPFTKTTEGKSLLIWEYRPSIAVNSLEENATCWSPRSKLAPKPESEVSLSAVTF